MNKIVEVPSCVVDSAIMLLGAMKHEAPGFYKRAVVTAEALRRCLEVSE